MHSSRGGVGFTILIVLYLLLIKNNFTNVDCILDRRIYLLQYFALFNNEDESNWLKVHKMILMTFSFTLVGFYQRPFY